MLYLLSINVVLWMGLLFWGKGPREALWGGWLVSLLLLPSWTLVPIGAFILDIRTVVAVVGLAGLWWAGELQGGRLLLADIVVGVLVISQICSEYLTGELGPLGGPEIMRLWVLPYLVGRFFLGRFEDIRKVLPYACVAVLLVSLYGIGEGVLQVNPVNAMLGQTFGFLEGAEGYRWGLKRAQGFMNHPISFGYLLVAFIPWVMEAFRSSLRGEGPTWWRFLPLAMTGCLLATGSRGAVLAGIVWGIVFVFIRVPRLRLPLAGLALLLGSLLLAFDDQLLATLAQFGGEGDTESTLMIRGEEVNYSGTTHRLLLFQAYEIPLATVGIFGFGSRLQGIDMDDVPQLFFSIDNHYLRFLLQFGYAALGLFVFLTLVTLFYLAQSAWKRDHVESRLATSLCGAMAGIGIMLVSVWFAPDFGSAWLFGAGLASNLRVLRRPMLPVDPPLAASTLLRLRFLPAHATLRSF